MNNLPSFNEFKVYDELLESVNSDLLIELNSLDQAEPEHALNEGALLNDIKNSLSKFILGPLSSISVIDKGRNIVIDLEMELIEKRDKFDTEIEELEKEIGALNRVDDRDRRNAMIKDRDSKIKEMETFTKAQKMKIDKGLEYIKKVIDGNPRRKEYFEAGRSEDLIGLAELRYKLAKDKADSSELKKYEDAIKKAKEDAERKANELKADIASKSGTTKTKDVDSPDSSVDPAEEKKKISGRKGKDIIKRKNELEKEIADLKSDIERKLKSLYDRMKKNPSGVSSKSLKADKNFLIIKSSELDAKMNILKTLRELGKTESDISKKISREAEFTKLVNKINQDITDGKDSNTGTKKVVSAIFQSLPEGTTLATVKLDTAKIQNAIDKINK